MRCRNVSALLVVACAAGALPSDAQAASTRRKPNHTQLHEGHSREIVHLKFREGTGIRLRQGRFAGRDEQAQALAALLRRYPGVRIERLFTRPEQTLDQERQRVERKSGRALPDKNLFYRLRLRAGTDAERLIDDLNALESVELAYPASRPMPPPTPSFFEDQGYLRPASESGIDADVAARVCGGRGSAVTVIDIEYDWNQSHEDLSKAAGALIPNGTPVSPFGDNNHGTAVLGELIADDNGFGVTGIVPDAGLGLVNASNDEDGYDLADAIDTAHASLTAGDVILIEQQVAGPNGCDDDTQFGCVAVEWDAAYWTAIASATADGIIVVEAAGNGMQDLDDSALYGSPFPDGRADSGAIIVGAGAAAGCTNPERSRLGFSTFGSRVNLQGWGECVTTTGYGGLQGGADPNLWYTSSFGGTSSASPIVAGAAASLSSVAETLAGVHLTSTQVRSLLESTGTPQDPGSAHIGPLPDLRAALATYEVVAPTLSCPSQVTAECTSPAGAAVSFNVTATDDCDPTPGVACDLPSGHTFALGTTPNSCDAEDAVGNDSSCAFNVIVEDTTDPVVNCPANVVVECTGDNGISASDPQLAAFFAGASATDICDAAPALSNNAPAFFGLGNTNVTFTATDASGNSSSCVATVTVADTTPPTINMSVSPTFLWPPNHSLRPITATVAVADICDPSPFYALTSITSNEADNGLGDGDQPGDIQDAAYGTPDLAFSLRAERGGIAVGRIYSVIYTASDHSGNTTPAGATVTVAHP